MKRRLADAIVVGAVLLWALLASPWTIDLVGGDEGYYATMARNLLAEPVQWARVSLAPLGGPGDKPPLVPAMLALVTALFGFSEGVLRIVPLASVAAAMLAAVRLGRRVAGERGGLLTAGLLATLPWLADGARVVAAEPTLAALGLWALVLLTGETLSTRRAAAAGALLGLAFLCKFWLVALLALPAAAALTGRPGRIALVTLLSAMATASMHLLLVLALTPGELAHWMNVMLGSSLASRAAGSGFAEYWLQPPTFYLRLLAQALLFWLPLLAVGLVSAWRQRRQPAARALLAALGSLALLSAFRVKAGGYLHPLVPLAGVVAALGAQRLLAWQARGALAPAGRALAVILVGLSMGGGAWRIAQRLPQRYHDPGYRDVAAYLAPKLAAASPTDTVLIAPEAPSFQALLFRTTDYWDTPYRPWSAERAAALASGRGPRWFVVDPSGRFYGGSPDSAAMAWLRTSTREVTGEIARAGGRPLEVRVFVHDRAAAMRP